MQTVDIFKLLEFVINWASNKDCWKIHNNPVAYAKILQKPSSSHVRDFLLAL